MIKDNNNENLINKQSYEFGDLLRVMEALLAPDGCPWDREQTHDSLKRYMIEEAYETLEAIDAGDAAMLCEELGDVLLQIVFHAKIASSFTIDDVIGGVCKKMISRHPHVFGSAVANTPDEVLTRWEDIKRDEKGFTDYAQTLKSVPSNLPALMRAYKVQQKARDAGFDWDDINPVLDKVEEELKELRGAVASRDNASVESELGDLLFATVNLSRFAHTHPELALTASTEKFIKRFAAMENMITGEGLNITDMTLGEMDVYWERVKISE